MCSLFGRMRLAAAQVFGRETVKVKRQQMPGSSFKSLNTEELPFIPFKGSDAWISEFVSRVTHIAPVLRPYCGTMI